MLPLALPARGESRRPPPPRRPVPGVVNLVAPGVPEVSLVSGQWNRTPGTPRRGALTGLLIAGSFRD